MEAQLNLLKEWEEKGKPRFFVAHNESAKMAGWIPSGVGDYYDFYWGYSIFDMSTPVPTWKGTDVAEPEDKTFIRDFDWIVDLLNEVCPVP